MDNYNYPVGSDTSDAPWNQVDQPEREIEVLVSVTLSKTVKVRVNDYRITDCGGNRDADFSECDLKGAVESQIFLPQEAYEFVTSSDVRPDLEGWNVDDFECILEQ